MDVDFKEPRLELHFLIRDAQCCGQIEKLRSYLVGKNNVHMYKRLAEEGVLPHSQADLDRMRQEISHTLEALDEAKNGDPDNESHIFEINKKICEFHAQIMDLEEFKKGVAEIVEYEPSLSLKMDIYLCRMRTAIILNDRAGLVESAGLATEVFEGTCDWDRKNRFKVYLGVYNLIKADFRNAAVLFSEGLASFEAPELLEFDHLILYYVFSALLSFTRTELSSKILENSEVCRALACTQLAEAYYSCDYGSYFRQVLGFIELFENDAIIGLFKEHFCKEMKIKGYGQLLLSYQSMYLDRMADAFNIQAEHLETDLRNFINEGRLPCVIDKVDGIVKIVEVKETASLELAVRRADNILRNIKKCIH